MFFRLSVFLFVLTTLSHFAVLATPMGIGYSAARWEVLDASGHTHTPNGRVQPGTFVPAVQLTSSQSSNDTSTEASPPTDTNSNNEPETSDGDTDSSSDPETNSNEESTSPSEDSASPSSSPSPDTSTPPSSSTNTNAALPANLPTIILPVVVTILSIGSGLF